MKKQFSIALLLGSMFSFSQVGIGTTTPDLSAQLDVSSITKGFLMPRMTNSQKAAIPSPVAPGLQIWCTDCGFNKGQLQFYNGADWIVYPIAVGSTKIPLAPRNIVATPSNGQASVSFAEPSGSFVITSYTVTSSLGGLTATGSSSPITVTGLTNGTPYTFTVVANSTAGNSAPSAASSAVTPFALIVPNAPTNVIASGYGSVSFTAPASNGGTAITAYTVKSTPGGFTATGIVSPITVSGLNSETLYTFTVFATNAAGNSATATTLTMVKPVCGAYVSTTAFKVFACHNLGVNTSRDPFSYQDGAINGDLYQWGRKADGHEIRNSFIIATQATNILATSPTTVVSRFISFDSNWQIPPINNLWGDGTFGDNPIKAANDPCPLGFEVPSLTQWQNVSSNNTWKWTGNGYTVGSFLYLPAAGRREGNILLQVGLIGDYWSSTTTGPGSAETLNFFLDTVRTGYPWRTVGLSVRCISEN
jgi:hypothetical protein